MAPNPSLHRKPTAAFSGCVFPVSSNVRQHAVRLRTALVLAHTLVVLSVVFVAYSLKHYLAIMNGVLPNVAALSPPGARIIANGSAEGMLLSAVFSAADFALYQLAGWFIAWVLAVAAVVALHRAKSRAA